MDLCERIDDSLFLFHGEAGQVGHMHIKELSELVLSAPETLCSNSGILITFIISRNFLRGTLRRYTMPAWHVMDLSFSS